MSGEVEIGDRRGGSQIRGRGVSTKIVPSSWKEVVEESPNGPGPVQTQLLQQASESDD